MARLPLKKYKCNSNKVIRRHLSLNNHLAGILQQVFILRVSRRQHAPAAAFGEASAGSRG